jgi:hypothetical protein
MKKYLIPAVVLVAVSAAVAAPAVKQKTTSGVVAPSAANSVAMVALPAPNPLKEQPRYLTLQEKATLLRNANVTGPLPSAGPSNPASVMKVTVRNPYAGDPNGLNVSLRFYHADQVAPDAYESGGAVMHNTPNPPATNGAYPDPTALLAIGHPTVGKRYLVDCAVDNYVSNATYSVLAIRPCTNGSFTSTATGTKNILVVLDACGTWAAAAITGNDSARGPYGVWTLLGCEVTVL